MPSRLPVPRFEDFSLTVGAAVWLHSSRWDEADAYWFQKHRHLASHQIDLGPPTFHPRKKTTARAEASWLFKATADGPTAWAELQIIFGARYRHGLLFLNTQEMGEQAFSHLSPLISSIFLIARLDLIRIITTGRLDDVWHQATKLSSLDKILYTLPIASWRPGSAILLEVHSLEVARNSWLESEAHQNYAHGYLKHIESRLKRYEQAEQKLKGDKRKRGLLARMFKPRIEDALL